MADFESFPKIARLNREIVITEKIDGTNAQIYIKAHPGLNPTVENTSSFWPGGLKRALYDGMMYTVQAGSRNRWITPDDDNFGFAKWVHKNADELVRLGEGRHYGEWWGQNIQRRYGLDEKRFSLFNTGRWVGGDGGVQNYPLCCDVVPVLFEGLWSNEVVEQSLQDLREHGSFAAPGFNNPEGIVVFHKASRQLYKVTLENDAVPKGLADGQLNESNR